jgi:hypothetical protein
MAETAVTPGFWLWHATLRWPRQVTAALLRRLAESP